MRYANNKPTRDYMLNPESWIKSWRKLMQNESPPAPQQEKTCILLILDTTHGQIGGTEKNTISLAQELKKKGYYPVLIEVGFEILKQCDDSDGLSIFNIHEKAFDVVGFFVWRKVIANFGPSAIIRSKTWAGCINWRLDLAAALSSAIYLSWEHHPANAKNLENNFTLKAFLKNYLRTLLHINTSKRTLAVSYAVRNALSDCYPIKINEIDIIYPGVDFEKFSYNKSASLALRKKWNIPESAFIIGSLGRLTPHKGNDFILKVVAGILKKNPSLNIWCVIAGKGSDLLRLQGISESLGIKDRTLFPGWQEDPSITWSAIDIFLMPSSDEGLGMTLIEAAACKCIPLSSPVGGMKEVLYDSLSQYSLPEHSIDAWVDMCIQLVMEGYEKNSARHNSIYTVIRQRFDAKNQWQKIAAWIDKNI